MGDGLWVMSELTLRYQRDIYMESVAESGLLVLGEGLGSWELLKSFIQCYADPKVLVFVLGLGGEEEDELMVHFTAGLPELVGHVPFNIIKNDTLGPERTRIYSQGGVISITSRIMLTDMLTGRLSAVLATGLCLFRAERTTENGLDAFILHLFRERNQEGFVKAISEAPEAFTLGFNQLEKMMKWMRLPNTVLLYPRFHSTVKDELDGSGLEIEELVLRPSQRTTIVQMALVSLVESCLKELVKLNPFLETVSLGQEGESMATLDALLGRQFDVLVKQQLEPVWHQIGFRTRQLVTELATLRSLLHSLFAYDAVTFLRYLQTVLDTQGTEAPANWVVLDAANTLIQVSRDRVLGERVEEPAKWNALSSLVAELKDEETVLILTESESTKSQVESLLAEGSGALLAAQLAEFRSWKAARGRSTPVSSARRAPLKRARRLPAVKDTEDPPKTNDPIIHVHSPLAGPSPPTNVLLRAYPEHGLALLESLRPSAVILYTQNLPFIRSLEVYAAMLKNSEPTSSLPSVFSMYHANSTEEQSYLLAVRREKNAFEALIKAKANLVVANEKSKADDGDESLERVLLGRNQGRSLVDDNSARPLIVDVRELRSSLPFILHKTGAFKLVPETITVGDYLLTPDCAVERKAIPDLIQSLNSGRLYTQAEALCRAYKSPVLLIEFDESRRAFSLLGVGDLRTEINGNDVMSRLCLLLLHFPKLKVIWSGSLMATAEIFGDLQREQADPVIPSGDMEFAVDAETSYNVTPKAMLEALPGVNQQNLYKLMNACRSMRDLSSKDIDELKELMGPANGKVLFDFIHNQF